MGAYQCGVRGRIVHGPHDHGEGPHSSRRLINDDPRHGDRASYEWQYSLNGGTAWLTMPTTLQARTSMQGLTVGTSVLFRSRSVTKVGEGNWTQGLAITVT